MEYVLDRERVCSHILEVTESSRLEAFCKKCVLKKLAKCTRRYLPELLFVRKLQAFSYPFEKETPA